MYLLKDINTVGVGSSPSSLRALDGRLFFTANDGTHGKELWVSDGRTGGTALVKDISPGTAGSSLDRFASMGGRLFFTIYEGGFRSLWVTDGTPGGTVKVKNIPPDGFWSTATLGDRLFFSSNEGSHGWELWVTDGTTDGKAMVKDIFPGPDSSGPGYSAAAGDLLFFGADDGVHGRELWMSDGTDAGTQMVQDLFPGSSGAFRCIGDECPKLIPGPGGSLFFTVDDGVHGRELWALTLSDLKPFRRGDVDMNRALELTDIIYHPVPELPVPGERGG